MTTASSSTASGLSVKALVLGGLAIVAVATTATVLWHRSKATAAKSRSPKSKRGLKKAARKTRQAAAVEIPSEEDLVGRIIRSMETMQTSGSVTGSNEVQLERIALAIEPSTLSTRARLLLAQWSILFYTIKTITGEQSGQQAEILRDMHEGMRHAWALLAVQSQCSPEEQVALDILQLDVAQRLRDPKRIAPVYQRVLERGIDRMSIEEILVMFTTSPLLGRWSDTRRLGDIILSRQKTLDDFHQAALQRPELPDYEVLYRLAADQASVPYSAGDTSHLMWTVYAIREFRIRLVSVESSDPMKAEQVRQSLDSEWQSTPVGDDARLFRHGAIGQMLSASEVKISMVGPWSADDNVLIEGYADLQKGADPSDGIVRQTERYEFRRAEESRQEGLWTGTYTLEQVQKDTHPSSIVVKFDLELLLQEDKSLGMAGPVSA